MSSLSGIRASAGAGSSTKTMASRTSPGIRARFSAICCFVPLSTCACIIQLRGITRRLPGISLTHIYFTANRSQARWSPTRCQPILLALSEPGPARTPAVPGGAPRRQRAAALRVGSAAEGSLRAPEPGRVRADLEAGLGAGVGGGAAGLAAPVVSGGVPVDVVAGARGEGAPAALEDPAGLGLHGEGGEGESRNQAKGAEKMFFHG